MTLPNYLQNLSLDDDFNQVRGNITKQLFEVDVGDKNRNHQIDTFRGTIQYPFNPTNLNPHTHTLTYTSTNHINI